MVLPMMWLSHAVKISVLFVLMACDFVGGYRFFCCIFTSALKMEAVCSYEMSVSTYNSTRR
jgi:hypothetical protein